MASETTVRYSTLSPFVSVMMRVHSTKTIDHGFMPIAVEVVSLDDYLVWLDSQT